MKTGLMEKQQNSRFINGHPVVINGDRNCNNNEYLETFLL